MNNSCEEAVGTGDAMRSFRFSQWKWEKSNTPPSLKQDLQVYWFIPRNKTQHRRSFMVSLRENVDVLNHVTSS